VNILPSYTASGRKWVSNPTLLDVFELVLYRAVTEVNSTFSAVTIGKTDTLLPLQCE